MKIRINFKECSDEELINAWCSVKDYMVKGEEKGLQSLTFFEILFLWACLFFQKMFPVRVFLTKCLKCRLL